MVGMCSFLILEVGHFRMPGAGENTRMVFCDVYSLRLVPRWSWVL